MTLAACAHREIPQDHDRPVLAQVVRVAFYPVTLVLTLCYLVFEANGKFGTPGAAYPVYLLVLMTSMLCLEWLVPMRREWGISKRSFLRRDLPMLVINGATIGGMTHVMQILGAGTHPTHSLAMLPWWAQGLLAVFLSDLVWYWVHRFSHERKGRLGALLWRTHLLHHWPRQVYLVMHVVAHPINAVYVRVILMLPLMLFGLTPTALFAATVLTGFHGFFSHFNVDVRAGRFNYVFMGTELHRYHHSADPAEGKNYAAVVTLWDILFGTFEYHPGVQPRQLGLHDAAWYAEGVKLSGLLKLPFMGPDGERDIVAAKGDALLNR